MEIELVDVTMHIREELDAEGLQEVPQALREIDGVVSARIAAHNPHLLVVTMNPRRVGTAAILNRLLQRGFHANPMVPERF